MNNIQDLALYLQPLLDRLSSGERAKLAKNIGRDLRTEPYRVCRRVNILRDYPDDKTKLYPRN